MPAATMTIVAQLFHILTFISLASATVYCPLESLPHKFDVTKTRNYYECPGHFPKNYVECCSDNECCPSHRSFYQIDHNSAYLIALFVSGFCLVFSVFLLLCCFWSACPLYNSCRMRYTRDEAGCAHKMGEVPYYSTMPLDSPTGNTVVIAHPLRDKPNGFINGNKCKEAAV